MDKRKNKLNRPAQMHLKPARFLDPKADIVFKKIFGNHPDLIKSFLNGVLPLRDDQLIQSVQYLTSEQAPRIPTLKNTIVDVKCTDKLGRIFIVEMQFNWTASFSKRLLFGVSKAYVQQILKGEEYDCLCPVYGLGIINDTFDSNEEWFHHYRTVNVKDSNKILEGLELIFLELPKFRPQTSEHRKMGVLWLRFLKEFNEQTVDVPAEFMQYPDLCKAIELTQESAYTLAELEAYDQFWDAIRVEKAMQNDARKEGVAIGKEEGIAIGKEEGIAIGKEAGIAIGKEAGIAIGKEEGKIQIAKKMLMQKIPVEIIASVTDLSLEEITALIS